jgi:hypothetical protein
MKKSYTSGHFELSIDGRKTTAYLKSLDGGYGRHNLIDERVGPENLAIKHSAVADTDPFSFEFGMSGANDVLKWIQSSWQKNPKPANGEIVHADFNMTPTFTHQFQGALITETTFPALDGASKEAAYIKVKCQPYATAVTKGGGGKLSGRFSDKQKAWLCSGFRMEIDDVPGMEFVNKIDSFTIKQGVKKMYTGKFRHPELIPTKIEFPNITGTISAANADGLLDWYNKYVVKGTADLGAQKTGFIEFLNPSKSKVLFRLLLADVGILNLQMLQSTANADQIKRVKFELYVGRMELDTMSGMS